VATTGGGPRLRPALVVGGWLVLAACFAGDAMSILTGNTAWLIARMPDDAFYYIRIGQHVAGGRGSTFDGVHLTNGFHPLWQAVVALAALVVPSGTGLIRLVLLLGLAFALAGTILLVRLAARIVGMPGALFAAILALHGPIPLVAQVNGMEGAAVVFALALLATVFRRSLETEDGFALLGLASALVVLARLDLILVAWLPAAVLAWRLRQPRVLIRWAWGLAAVGLPVAAAWQLEYGHLLSVSGTVKQAWMTRLADEEHGGRLTAGFVRQVARLSGQYGRDVVDVATASQLPADATLGALTWVALLIPTVYGLSLAVGRLRTGPGRVTAAGAIRCRRRRPATLAFAALVAMVVIKSVIDMVLSTRFSVGTWYSAPEFIILPMALGLLAWVGLRRMLALVPVIAMVIAAALAVCLVPSQPWAAVQAGRTRYDDSLQRPRTIEASQWINDQRLVARFGFTDTGVAAWFIQPPSQVVNLDGFVNDYAYADLVNRQAPLDRRLAEQGVEVLLVWARQDQVADILACGRELWSSKRSSVDDDQQLHIVDVRPCGLTAAARAGVSVATHPGINGPESSSPTGPDWGLGAWLALLVCLAPAAALLAPSGVVDAHRGRHGSRHDP
jgi:hypothetical protein